MKTVRCVLQRGKERPVKNRHPWIFSGAIDRIDEGFEAGDLVRVLSDKEEFLGVGYLNPGSQIVVRMLAFEDVAIDEPFFDEKIGHALEMRKRFLSRDTNAYRLIHSEGDFLSGLTVDVYGDFLVAEFNTAGIDAWIDTYHAVQRLTRQGTFVFLTDSAIGAQEEDNLRHLVTNLGNDVPRERIVPFLTSKHSLEYCLSYAERAHQKGFPALVVLGGDRAVGTPRSVEHAWQLRKLLRDMLLIRRFEERAGEQYALGRVGGFCHLYIGQEAVAVGAMAALREGDLIMCSYREHGQALARGLSAGRIMAEMYGKANGCSRGRGGSMHLFDAARRFYGGYAIVAGGLPIAVGLALADKMLGRRAVTACFFGDGAVAEGEFHESLNLAALWRLPLLFLCENNLYGMGTSLERSESQTDIHLKAQNYNILAEAVDGMDVLAVESAVERARAQVRRGDGPYFLELRTYRYRAHSMSDPELYRSKEEVAHWRERDPIALFDAYLRGQGMLDDAALKALEADVANDIDWAVAEAEKGGWEPLADLARDVYAAPVSSTAESPAQA